MVGGFPTFRASAPLTQMVGLSPFGLLINLAGTWMGKGFNLVSVPLSPQSRGSNPGAPTFAPKISATREVLVITPLGSPVPNRGFVEDDIFLFGLTYLQVVNDVSTLEARHFETGLWLNIPDTSPPTVARQAVIPHGDSLLARGTVTESDGSPQIPAVSTRPIDISTQQPINDVQFLAPFKALTLPPEIPPGSIDDPNEVLRKVIQSQTISRTTTIDVSASQDDIVNLPFIRNNANVVSLKATFWIESVLLDNGMEFSQLQYSQIVMLRFDGLDWPHISVATLLSQ
jgi:hypothetical protein